VGLGEVLFKLGTKPTPPRVQQGGQAQSVEGDFVAKYLRCLGLSPNELDKAAEVLKGRGVNEDTIKCIEDLMKSVSWDELFTKINLETALFEVVAKHELQGLTGHGGNVSNASLPLLALHDFITSLNIIRQLMNNDNTRPMAMITLAKITYLLFDLFMELSKRKAIPPNLEVEIWRVREVIVDVMRELFKGNGTMTVDGKSFDANRQLR
jgi:hypothetical protein